MLTKITDLLLSQVAVGIYGIIMLVLFIVLIFIVMKVKIKVFLNEF